MVILQDIKISFKYFFLDSASINIFKVTLFLDVLPSLAFQVSKCLIDNPPWRCRNVCFKWGWNWFNTCSIRRRDRLPFCAFKHILLIRFTMRTISRPWSDYKNINWLSIGSLSAFDAMRDKTQVEPSDNDWRRSFPNPYREVITNIEFEE